MFNIVSVVTMSPEDIVIKGNQPFETQGVSALIDLKVQPSIASGIAIHITRRRGWYEFNVLNFSKFYQSLNESYNDWYHSYYNIDELEEFLSD